MTIQETLSYDDVLLLPGYADFLPAETDVSTRIVGDIHLKVPILSAAMDTVTEDRLAIELALHGGAGVIHRNMPLDLQAEHVARVKRFLNLVIEDPVTVTPTQTISDVSDVMEKFGISGLPVVDKGRLVGIITSRDLRFCRDGAKKVSEVMTRDPIVEVGSPDYSSAQEKFDAHKIEKLPVVDESGALTGLVTVKDIEKHNNYPNAAIDPNGRLIVGAAVSPTDLDARMEALVN
ncbi:MAG: IMP dehydrogenase, partial [Spirochaetaceae bacterium]|nr:IMP dehydrogenase [Spirochaetaceae bacterium]